jgi:hypothetical protein
MFAAVPTWCLLVLAGVVIVVRWWSCLLRLFCAKSYRVDVVGEHSDVAPGVANGLYADYYRQLLDLGFEPLGVFRESIPGYRAGKEYAFVHPDLQCRAAIFTLCGGANVALKSDTRDGRLVKTTNTGAEENQETADFIVRRRPTHSMQELLEVHQEARSAWVKDGAALVLPRTIDEEAEFEQCNFFNSSLHRRYRSALINRMFYGLFCVVLFSACMAFEFRGDFWRTFSLFVIAFTGTGYVRRKMREREFRQKQEQKRDAAQSSLDAAVA